MSHKKNILIVIASLRLWGGAEKVATTLGTKLIEDWYSVHYLTFYNVDKKYLFKWSEICLDEKLTSNPLLNSYKLLQRARKIKKVCKKHNIDTSISFMEEANFSNILSKVVRNKSKIIISIRQSVNVHTRIYKKLIKLLYNFANVIVPLVEEEKQNLVDNYNIKAEKIIIINNAIDMSKIESLKNKIIDKKHRNLFQEDLLTFINMGRLTHQKNQELLIAVFQKFQKKYQKTQLIILWEGELRKDLENQIGNSKSIHLLWNQSNPYQFLHQSDCFVLTSNHEWFPNALLEAMATWLPVISTDCPTWPKEILQNHLDSFESVAKLTQADYGILTPVGDQQSLYDAMKLLYTDEDLRNHYKKRALTRAKDFEIEKIVKQWEGLFYWK